METIALINQKGGVGKTTSVVNIGAGLAILGKRVLLTDLDSQSHLGRSLGIPTHELTSTVYDLLNGGLEPGEVLVRKELGAKINRIRTDGEHGANWESSKLSIAVLPSNLLLSQVDMELADVPGKEFLLKDALSRIEHRFDYALIDCAPSLGLLTINALTAADKVLIPVQAEYLALESLSRLMETIERVKEQLNPSLEVGGIIATRYDQRRLLNREVVSKLEEHFEDLIYKTKIRENIVLAEAPSYGVDIFTYRPKSYGAEDYLKLCQEILQRSWRHVA